MYIDFFTGGALYIAFDVEEKSGRLGYAVLYGLYEKKHNLRPAGTSRRYCLGDGSLNCAFMQRRLSVYIDMLEFFGLLGALISKAIRL